MKRKIKFVSIIISYISFAMIVIFSFNAVIPEPELQVLKTEMPLIKKIENNFNDNENSVYQILKEDIKDEPLLDKLNE